MENVKCRAREKLRVLCPVHALLPIDALYVGQYYSYRKSIGASHATLHEDPKFPAQPLSLSGSGHIGAPWNGREWRRII